MPKSVNTSVVESYLIDIYESVKRNKWEISLADWERAIDTAQVFAKYGLLGDLRKLEDAVIKVSREKALELLTKGQIKKRRKLFG